MAILKAIFYLLLLIFIFYDNLLSIGWSLFDIPFVFKFVLINYYHFCDVVLIDISLEKLFFYYTYFVK